MMSWKLLETSISASLRRTRVILHPPAIFSQRSLLSPRDRFSFQKTFSIEIAHPPSKTSPNKQKSRVERAIQAAESKKSEEFLWFMTWNVSIHRFTWGSRLCSLLIAGLRSKNLKQTFNGAAINRGWESFRMQMMRAPHNWINLCNRIAI